MRSLWFPFTKCTFYCDAVTIFLYHCYSQFNCTMAWCVQHPALWGLREGQVCGGRWPLRTGGHQQTGTEPPPPKPHGAVSTSKGQTLTAGRWEAELVLHTNKSKNTLSRRQGRSDVHRKWGLSFHPPEGIPSKFDKCLCWKETESSSQWSSQQDAPLSLQQPIWVRADHFYTRVLAALASNHPPLCIASYEKHSQCLTSFFISFLLML